MRRFLTGQNLLLLLLAAIAFIFFIANGSYNSIWFDEGFSIILIKNSFSEIWAVTATDVHPPLYYLMLKLFTLIFGDSIQICRFFSTLPILLLIVVACIKVRKIWGFATSSFFVILLTFMPVMQYAAYEIRMYSWAMFFVFMTFIYAYESYKFSQWKWTIGLKFLLFSLAAAYTHTYALISVFFIYAIYFIALIVRDRRRILPFIGISVCFTICYLPWIINLLYQVSVVKEDYWITPINADSFLSYLFYYTNLLYSWGNKADMWSFIYRIKGALALILWFVSLILGILAFKNRKQANGKFYIAVLSFIVFLLPIATGIVISLVVRPVYVSRFSLSAFGVALLGVSLLFSSVDYAKLYSKVLVCIFFVILMSLSLTRFRYQMYWKNYHCQIQSDLMSYVKKNIDDRSVFLYSSYMLDAVTIYPVYFPNTPHICYHDSLYKYNDETLKHIAHIPIYDYDQIDTTYNTVFVADNYNTRVNLMNVSKDSIEISKHFKIVDEHETQGGYKIYKLERYK